MCLTVLGASDGGRLTVSLAARVLLPQRVWLLRSVFGKGETEAQGELMGPRAVQLVSDSPRQPLAPWMTLSVSSRLVRRCILWSDQIFLLLKSVLA